MALRPTFIPLTRWKKAIVPAVRRRQGALGTVSISRTTIAQARLLPIQRLDVGWPEPGKDCFHDFFQRSLWREKDVGLSFRDCPGAKTVQEASFTGGQPVASVTRAVVVHGVEFPRKVKGIPGLPLAGPSHT